MPSISDDWQTDRDLPNTLHTLMSETAINNSFSNKDVTDQLTKSMESSYAYLYRYQRDTVPYRRFHYRTREYLLTTSYNDIQTMMKKYRQELAALEESGSDKPRIDELKSLISDIDEIRYGDFYLDKTRRLCVDIPYDMIDATVRSPFRRSPLYDNEMTLGEISDNKKYFLMFPIIILDGGCRTDVLIKPIEKGTRIIFPTMSAKDMYTGEETHVFHSINVLFVRNASYHQVILKDGNLAAFKNSNGKIQFSSTDFETELLNNTRGRTGMLFSYIIDSKRRGSGLIESEITEDGVVLSMDRFAQSLVSAENVSLEVCLCFMDNMYRHDFSSPNGAVPSVGHMVESGSNYVEKFESNIFVPMVGGDPLAMPIPEDNFLIFSNNGPEDSSYSPKYGVGVEMYYPNLYQVSDDNMTKDSTYRVYFFYRDEPDIKYTPLTNFYTQYLLTHFNGKYSIEYIYNLIYFRLPGYDRNDYLVEQFGADAESTPGRLEDEILDAFYDFFIRFMMYRDYNYVYGTPDFMDAYVGDNVPLQYKISRMREFVRADYKILRNYVKREQDKTTLYHFFVNSVELRDRFRRSTVLEDHYNPKAFVSSFTVADPGLVGSLRVVDTHDYNPSEEIHIDDVRIELPGVNVGMYVIPNGDPDRYLFTFRNENSEIPLPIKIYIDGLRVSTYDVIHFFGTDYIYIPTRYVSESSYIMVEREYGMVEPQTTLATFADSSTWVEFNYVSTKNLSYTVNDVFVREHNGLLVDREMYDIELVNGDFAYDMNDERAKKKNKYGTMASVRIRLKPSMFTSGPVAMYVTLNKISYTALAYASKRGYPRFDMTKFSANPNTQFLRMYYNGRVVPEICYKVVQSCGRYYIQSKMFCEPGDEFIFEFSPYAKDLILKIDEFEQNSVMDFSEILDKPIDPEYYEVFVNGRRLGLPNVFEFGPHHGVFKGLKSKYLLEIYEKERDFEYFGYRQINLDPGSSTHKYYFEPIDLYNQEFVSDEERVRMIDDYVDSIKHPNAVINDNVDGEVPIVYDFDSDLGQELKIFYFEEVLPLTLGDPNSLQFLHQYLTEVFPCTVEVFEKDDGNGNKVIFLDPNITVRFDNDGSHCQISTGDINRENSVVMLLGEEDFTQLMINEGQLDVPVEEYRTEFTDRMYALEKIYIDDTTKNKGEDE